MNVLLPLWSLRRFSFTTIATSTSVELPIVRAIDVGNARELILIVRVHTLTTATGSSISVIARDVSQTAEAPGVDFVDNASAIATAFFSAGTAPALVMAAATSTFGRLARIVVKGTRGTLAGPSADLAVDLLLKE